MEHIIQQINTEMLEEELQIFQEYGFNLDEAMPRLFETAKNATLQMFNRLLQEMDDLLYSDKENRHKEGWMVERRKDRRTILTKLGEFNYQRTYYHNQKTNEHKYLVDEIVGVLPYMRVSNGLSEKLVQKSRHISYQQSSEQGCDGKVSKQTVMNKIRKAKPVIEIPPEKRQVPELHIDADEDHVALQGKRRKACAMVPLVSVYEGFAQHGKRRYCKNVFHISDYQRKPDELWEGVLTRIEQRYDLTDTKIYIHGDGASWIAKGKEWFPQATFVLDMYHKNEYIRRLLAGYDPSKASQLRRDIDQALNDIDEDYFDNIVGLLLDYSPQREVSIREAAVYLRNHMADISIRAADAAARNGGATEPHVSHVLSARLSSRPKGWSAETLRAFAPILANGSAVTMVDKSPIPTQGVVVDAQQKLQKRLQRRNTSALCQSSLPVVQSGKRTQLYNLLHGITYNILH